MLVVVKELFPLSTIENIWMRQFDLQRDTRFVFPSRKTLTKEVLPCMVKCTLEEFILPTYFNVAIFLSLQHKLTFG